MNQQTFWLAVAIAVSSGIVVSVATGAFAWLWKRAVDGQFETIKETAAEVKHDLREFNERGERKLDIIKERISEVELSTARMEAHLGEHIKNCEMIRKR